MVKSINAAVSDVKSNFVKDVIINEVVFKAFIDFWRVYLLKNISVAT